MAKKPLRHANEEMGTCLSEYSPSQIIFLRLDVSMIFLCSRLRLAGCQALGKTNDELWCDCMVEKRKRQTFSEEF